MEFLDLTQDKVYDETEPLYNRILNGEVEEGELITVKGAIHSLRNKGGDAFIVIRTARHTLQFYWEQGKANFEAADLKEGDSVVMSGRIRKSEYSRIGYDIDCVDVNVLSSPSDVPPFSIGKREIKASFDTILDYRPISMRHPKERAYIKLVEGVMRGMTEWLYKNNFTQIIPPKIVAAGAEGGADMFELDYFGKKAYLAQSPQFYKQMMVGVYERVFTVSPVFRAEKHRTSRHINEFMGIDLEMGYIDSFYDVCEAEARALRYTFDLINREYKNELEIIGADPLPSFDKVPYVRFDDAKRMVKEKYGREFRSEYDLEPEEEKLVGKLFKEEYGSELVFVTHYPSKKRPFYAMDDPSDPRYTLSFDLLLNGTEITTGGQRIHDYEMQVNKMKDRGMNPDDFASYLMIHKYGMPPHGGLGIGVERLAMKLFNVDNIRTVTLFPRDTERLEP